METMNVTFDELSAMAFEQSSSKPGLQSMTSGQISSGLDLTYAPSTITTQKPTEGDLDLLFEAMYDDFIGGQPSSAPRAAPAAQAPQVLQPPTATTTTADSTPTPIIASSQATDLSNTSQDVDELEIHQHVQHQPATIADNVPNAIRVYGCQLKVSIDADHQSHVFKLMKALYGFKASNQGHMVRDYVNGSPTESLPQSTMIHRCLRRFDDGHLSGTEILKKYGMETCDPIGTPMEIKDKLDLDQKMGLQSMQQNITDTIWRPLPPKLFQRRPIQLSGSSPCHTGGNLPRKLSLDRVEVLGDQLNSNGFLIPRYVVILENGGSPLQPPITKNKCATYRMKMDSLLEPRQTSLVGVFAWILYESNLSVNWKENDGAILHESNLFQ
ncbi:hypothetical protein Tco_0544889 [Tanacetum coccineum]